MKQLKTSCDSAAGHHSHRGQVEKYGFEIAIKVAFIFKVKLKKKGFLAKVWKELIFVQVSFYLFRQCRLKPNNVQYMKSVGAH